jgi:tetratricopeptide (TPR) repeat protein
MERAALKVFVSYKWQDDAHNAWVQRLAKDLCRRGIDAILDVWEVRFGDSFSEYMTRRIQEADVFLFVITSGSVAALQAPGASGSALKFEMQIATARKLAGEQIRIIGLYREGYATPTYLRDHRHVDFRDDAKYKDTLKLLVDDLLQRTARPALRATRRLLEHVQSEVLPTSDDRTEVCLSAIDRDARAEFQAGEEMLSAGDVSGAVNKFRSAVAIEPKFTAAWSRLGSAESRLGNHEAGIRALKTALDINPKDPMANASLGFLHLRLGNLEEGATALRRAMLLNPYDGRYHAGLGLAFELMGDHTRAAAAYLEAVRLSPEHAEFHARAARQLAKLGQTEQAAREAEKLLGCEGRTADQVAEVFCGLAEAEMQKGKDDLSRPKELLEAAINFSADNLEAHRLLASLHAAAREFADAIKEYRHVLELAPDDTGTRFMLGFTYVDMQDWPSAITTLKEVIYRDPAHSAAYGFLQYALSENGNIAEAEAIREQAAKLTSAGKPVGTRTSGPQT